MEQSQIKIRSFYFTSQEIKKLLSYLITTSNWLFLSNCNNNYEKGKYCLIHDIEKRFINCYWGF